MKRSRFTEEQIANTLREVESGQTTVRLVCRKLGVSQPTYYLWKRKRTGGASDTERILKMEDEIRTLKQLVTDLSLEKQRLQNAILKKDIGFSESNPWQKL